MLRAHLMNWRYLGHSLKSLKEMLKIDGPNTSRQTLAEFNMYLKLMCDVDENDITGEPWVSLKLSYQS